MQIQQAKDLTTEKVTCLIYAPPGMGKTTLLGELEGRTLILDIDKGTSVLKGKENIDVIRVSEDLHEMKEVLDFLKAKNEYQNLALDSLSEMERAMLAYYGRIGNNNGVPDQGSYQRVDFKIIDWCRRFRELPCNLFLTAWESYKDMVASSGEKYLQAYPMIRDKNMNTLCGLCDIVGQIVVKDDERIVKLKSTAGGIAKDRIFKRDFCKFGEILGGN